MRERERENARNFPSTRCKKKFNYRTIRTIPREENANDVAAPRGEGNRQRLIKSRIIPRGNKTRCPAGDIYKGDANPPIKSSHRRHNRQHPAFSHPSSDPLSDGMRHRRRHSQGHTHGFICHLIERMGCWTHTKGNGTFFFVN